MESSKGNHVHDISPVKCKKLLNACKKFKWKPILIRLFKQHGLRYKDPYIPKRGENFYYSNSKIVSDIVMYHENYRNVMREIKSFLVK